jgi:co-chaperonin GroES (HSP10)
VSIVNHAPFIEFGYVNAEEAFPKVRPNHRPLGEQVLIQIRKAMTKSKGGIILDENTRQTEHDNTQVGKLVAKGALAFCDRHTGKPWPEGDWVKLGDYVRVRKYGGDRWVVKDKDGEPVQFLIVRDTDLLAEVENPLDVRSFI